MQHQLGGRASVLLLLLSALPAHAKDLLVGPGQPYDRPSAAIRAASRMLVDGQHPRSWVDPAALDISDIGDFAIALGDIEKSLALIERLLNERWDSVHPELDADDEAEPPEPELQRGAQVGHDLVAQNADARHAEDDAHRDERDAAGEQDGEPEAPLERTDERVRGENGKDQRGAETEHDAQDVDLRRTRHWLGRVPACRIRESDRWQEKHACCEHGAGRRATHRTREYLRRPRECR